MSEQPRECAQCQAALEEDDSFCSRCGAPAPATPATCPNCGNPFREGARFCNKCGAAREGRGAEPQSRPSAARAAMPPPPQPALQTPPGDPGEPDPKPDGPQPDGAKRPGKVTLLVWMLRVLSVFSVLAGLAFVVFGADIPTAVPPIALGVALLISAALLMGLSLAVAHQRQWLGRRATIFYAVLALAFGFLNAGVSIEQYDRLPPGSVFVFVFWGVALWILFCRSTRRWFRAEGANSAPKSEAPVAPRGVPAGDVGAREQNLPSSGPPPGPPVSAMPASSRERSSDPTPPPDGPSACAECGAALPPPAVFCPECGART